MSRSIGDNRIDIETFNSTLINKLIQHSRATKVIFNASTFTINECFKEFLQV